MRRYKQILLESDVEIDKHYMDRYFKFIDYYLDNPPEIVENVHHILPKYKDCWKIYSDVGIHKWNGVGLTIKQHYIAHLLLAKALPEEKKLIFATHLLAKNSDSSNTTLTKKISSRFLKDYALVYDINDPEQNIFFVSVFDEKYKSGEYVFYRTGKKHKQKTRDKMSKTRTGMKWATNGVDHILCRENELPEGYYFGYNFEVDREHIKETVWAYNKETGEQKRIHKEKVPKGWVVGRTDNGWAKGLEKANQMTTIVDFSERKCKKVFDFDKSVCGPESGTNTEKTYIFIYDNKIFTCFKKVYDFAKKQGIFLNSDLEKVVPNPHHNNTKESFEFRKKYCGKTYSDLGLRKYKLTEFPLSEMEGKEIYWNE